MGNDAGTLLQTDEIQLLLEKAAAAGYDDGVELKECADLLELEGREVEAVERELEERGVPVRVLAGGLVKRRVSVRYALALRRLLAAEQCDLVHAHLYASEAAAMLALGGRDTPLVVTEQTEAPWRSRRARLVSRAVYRRSAHVIAVSSAIRRRVAQEFGVPPSKLTVVRNSVTAAQTASSARNGHPVVGTVARLQPEKGLDVLLEAAPQIAREVPEVEFRVVGDGPLRADLERRAREVGAERFVTFLGERSDARELLASFDVLALPSRAEGTPLTIVESMLAGTPVVASAVGGIPEQISHGETGLLVPAEDRDSLAASVVQVLRDRELATRLAEGARVRAEREFTHSAMLAKVEAVYAAACSNPASTSSRGRASTSSSAADPPSRARIAS